MAVKYVKDFGFDSGFGYTGSAGKTPVRAYMRGGAVKKNIAPAMVEKKSPGMGGKAAETKKLAPYNKPHMEGKKGPSAKPYASGGAVTDKEMMSMKKDLGNALTDKERRMVLEGMSGSLGKGKSMREKIAEKMKGESGSLTDKERRILEQIAGSSDDYAKGGSIVSRLRGKVKDKVEMEGRGEDRGGRGEVIEPMPPKASPLAKARQMMMARREMMADRGEPTMRRPMQVRRPMPVRRAMPVAPRGAMLPPKPGSIMRDALGHPVIAAEPVSPENRLRPSSGLTPAMYAKGGKVSKGEKKIGKVMGEFKRGELHSGSKKGPVVKNPKQAVAIALSEARHAGAKIPKKARGGMACD